MGRASWDVTGYASVTLLRKRVAESGPLLALVGWHIACNHRTP